MTVLHMDCRAGMAMFPDNTFDSIVTDPPYELGFMGKSWDATGIAYDVDMWREALRVLKPGGHLLSFSGSRTYHRMTCAIEDAGFEIRDQIMWVYGSGFPKSLDVSKAIDKANGRGLDDWYALGRHIRDCRIARGLSVKAVNAHFGGTALCNHWESQNQNNAIPPTPEHWATLKSWMGCDASYDEIVDRAGAAREVVGERKQRANNKTASAAPMNASAGEVELITAPATDAARQWEGWGTALKPAHEPICVARKPLKSADVNVLVMVESALRQQGVRGDIIWTSERASDAGRKNRATNSSSTAAPQAGATYAGSVGANASRNSGQQTPKNSAQIMPPGASQSGHMFANTTSESGTNCATTSSTHTAESASVAPRPNAIFSPSTTLQGADLRIDGQITGRSTPNLNATVTPPDTACFAGIATGLPGSMATVHITQDTSGAFLWPAGLPKFVPGSPLTVAANVLAHGCGAINIDGCRVGTDGGTSRGANGSNAGKERNVLHGGNFGIEKLDAGRWPANLIHDGNVPFPDAKGQQGETAERQQGTVYGAVPGDTAHVPPRIELDTSAARFFYCAKASKSDRGEGNTHPTVKPHDLMRYLLRLVTPPGGTALDPFAGSGSTFKAASVEGFDFIGFELQAEYVAIANARGRGAM